MPRSIRSINPRRRMRRWSKRHPQPATSWLTKQVRSQASCQNSAFRALPARRNLPMHRDRHRKMLQRQWYAGSRQLLLAVRQLKIGVNSRINDAIQSAARRCRGALSFRFSSLGLCWVRLRTWPTQRAVFTQGETYLADNGAPLLRFLVFTAALFASAPGEASWSVENDRSTSNKHGLFEIREEARRFISNENAKGLQQWEVLEPNLKTFVPRCVVPLKAQWTPKSFGLSRPSVMVICTAAIPNIAMGSWHVHVPVRQK